MIDNKKSKSFIYWQQKLTTKSYLQLISLRKLFSKSTIYNSFRLKKIKRHLNFDWKIHSIRNIYTFERKKNPIKKR